MMGWSDSLVDSVLDLGAFSHHPHQFQIPTLNKFILPLSYHDPAHGEDRQCDTFINSPTELSWSRPWGGQIVGYIHSPIELSWPWPGEDRQWATFILPLSYHDPGHGEDRQWDSFVLSLSYHNWAIMTRVTDRTDSEIHSFSHWAITTELRITYFHFQSLTYSRMQFLQRR